MAEHAVKYLNGTVLQQVVSAWPHLFQARQYKGKGDFKYDVSLILTDAQKEMLRAAAEQLAIEAFPNGEYNSNPLFAWPWTKTELKTNSPKLGEIFPGHWIISAKAYEDNPAQVMIPDNNNPGNYLPMPEGMRAQMMFDGALCYAGIDLASYDLGAANLGIRVQINFIVYYGAGTKVAIGARPDANTGMAGINVSMQTPAGMDQIGADGGQAAGVVNTGMPVQTGQVQTVGTVQQQAAPQQQVVQQQAAPQQQVVQQQVPVQTGYVLPDGTPCDANGNPLPPQVDFT